VVRKLTNNFQISLLKEQLISYSPWIISIFTILITLYGCHLSILHIREKSQQNFDILAERLETRIKERMTRYEDILHETAGLFYAVNPLNYGQWQTYFTNLDIAERYQGIDTISYIEYVPEEKRQDFDKEIRQWFPQAKIWPPGKRTGYFPIKYTLKRNSNAVGFDTSTDPVRYRAMEIARDSGLPSITGKTIIYSHMGKYPGLVLFLPLYNRHSDSTAGTTAGERRENLKGFIGAVFTINEFLQGILTANDEKHIDFEVFNGSNIENSSLLFDKTRETSILDPGYKPDFFRTITSQLYNQTWTIYCIPTRNFVTSNFTIEPFLILIGGMALSLSLFGFIRTMLLTQNKAVEIAGQMTAELKEKEAFIRELYNTTSGPAKFPEKVSFLLAMGCQKLGLKNGILAKINNDSYEILQIHSEDYPLRSGEVLSITDAYVKKLSMMLEPAGFTDSRNSEIINNELYNQLKFESYLSTPVFVNGRVYGTLDFSDISPRENNFSDTERTIVKLIAQWIGNELERNYAEEKIKSSLKEKEVLLKEIHHRVKNNLQVVSSLLSLQSAHIKDQKAIEIFREGQLRIKSMALIHQNLYQSEHLDRINFSGYIEKLVNYLFQSYGISPELVKLKINIADVPIDLDSAIPCGLIINELVSNSLKYAFLDREGGEITISLITRDNNYILVICDNGTGIPEGVDFFNTQTLGLQLVNTLVTQLEGKIKLNSNKGETEFIISFPNPKNDLSGIIYENR
jgi:two-component sensor histidine kinase/CHASE1-domain containing sensor protein